MTDIGSLFKKAKWNVITNLYDALGIEVKNIVFLFPKSVAQGNLTKVIHYWLTTSGYKFTAELLPDNLPQNYIIFVGEQK